MERRIGSDATELRREWEFVRTTSGYHPESELEKKAYEIILEKHVDQRRKDGSPYTDHLVAVASIIRDVMGVKDGQVLAAALLHDIVEDTDMTIEEVEVMFGSVVARLVAGVTELKDTGESKKKQDIETTRKVVRESGLDVRVALIKLADRTHNVLTLESMPSEKKVAKARETFDVYVPLAESLGVWEFKRKLEDMAVFYLYPEKMATAKAQIDVDPRLNIEFLYHWKTRLERMLEEMGIEGGVEWQLMGYWEAVKKKEQLGVRDFSQVQLVSFRVRVPSEFDCRTASQFLRIHERGLVDPHRADDYITEQTYNGYTAMHESLRPREGSVEVAFATEEMEDFNAWGVVGELRRGGDLGGCNLKLFFDPEGRVIRFLPEEATGVDLIVSIDAQLLRNVRAVIVDGERLPLSVNIPNAAIVELEVDDDNGLDTRLFEYAMLPKTKEKLREFVVEMNRTEDSERGRGILKVWMEERGFDDLNDLVWGEGERRKMRLVLMELGVNTVEELYLELGLGNRAVEEVVRVLESSELGGLRTEMMKIRLSGHDGKGIMAEVSDLISSYGGVIRLSRAEGDGEVYEFELVVAGMGKEDKQRFRDELVSDGARYLEVAIV